MLETNTFFVKSETINFKEWSEESFGVYHGDEKKPLKLCLIQKFQKVQKRLSSTLLNS